MSHAYVTMTRMPLHNSEYMTLPERDYELEQTSQIVHACNEFADDYKLRLILQLHIFCQWGLLAKYCGQKVARG